VAIHLAEDRKVRVAGSIERDAIEALDEDFGDLEASMMLPGFSLREIAFAVYNQAIADAGARMHERIDDLDGVCDEPGFTYREK
jgi:uncharacterized protein (DUF2164 family)